MDGDGNLIRMGEVNIANEKTKTRNSFNELCVKGAEKWSSSQK